MGGGGTGESKCFDPALAALLQYTLSNLGRDMSDESTGRSTASSLVQSLSVEVRKRGTTEEMCVCVWEGGVTRSLDYYYSKTESFGSCLAAYLLEI